MCMVQYIRCSAVQCSAVQYSTVPLHQSVKLSQAAINARFPVHRHFCPEHRLINARPAHISNAEAGYAAISSPDDRSPIISVGSPNTWRIAVLSVEKW